MMAKSMPITRRHMLNGIRREIDLAVRETAHSPTEDRLIDVCMAMLALLEDLCYEMVEAGAGGAQDDHDHLSKVTR